MSKIELTGFKSFAEHTTLEFGESVTLLTGKSRSGKSNFHLAIKWALGETVYDVLFRGSGAREAAKSATVRLTFKRKDRNLIEVPEEIRIERSLSNTEYDQFLVDGRPATLSQLKIALVKIGIDHPANLFIEQKSINPFLTSMGDITHRAFAREMGLAFLRKQIIAVKRECLLTKLNLSRIESIQRELGDVLKAEMPPLRSRNPDLDDHNRRVKREDEQLRQMHHDHSVQNRHIEMHIQKVNKAVGELQAKYNREFQLQIELVMQVLAKLLPMFLPGSNISLELLKGDSALESRLDIYLLTGGNLRLISSLDPTEMQLTALAVILSIRLLQMPPFLHMDGIAAPIGSQLSGQLANSFKYFGTVPQTIISDDAVEPGKSGFKVFEVRMDEEGVSSVQTDHGNQEGTISGQGGR